MRRHEQLAPGEAVGLLGGSFDPPHAGHLHITQEALKRFGLARVLWLVSPGNPLKADAPAALARRMAAAQDLAQDPRIIVSDFEARAGTRYTAQTLAHLRKAYPTVHFVWLMGADNLAQFHRWKDWQKIMAQTPVGVLARPGTRQAALHSKAAQMYRGARVAQSAARLLAHRPTPAWCFVNVPMRSDSSTALRRAGQWSRGDGSDPQSSPKREHATVE